MPRHLPREFEFSHDLSFVLHDMLSRHVVEGEKAGLRSFEVPLNQTCDHAALGRLDGEDAWRWLAENGYQHVLDDYTYRELAFALLADMCHYIYEGLRCSEKGKLSVAYSNFRKPIQDNLYYLEWMLGDWPGFLASFRQGPQHLDIAKLAKDARKPRRLEVIARAMNQMAIGEWIAPEFLYELRYDKASEIGLDWVFTQAVHLVTTFAHNETSPEDLNFVFCDDEDREHLWHHLYLRLPLILIHALHVVRSLFGTFGSGFRACDVTTDFWLIAGLFLWAQKHSASDRHHNAATAMFRSVFAAGRLNCMRCGVPIEFDRLNTQRFWDDGKVRCAKCKRSTTLLVPRHVKFEPASTLEPSYKDRRYGKLLRHRRSQ